MLLTAMKTLTAEHRAKISAKLKGVEKSALHRQHLREALIRRWAVKAKALLDLHELIDWENK